MTAVLQTPFTDICSFRDAYNHQYQRHPVQPNQIWARKVVYHEFSMSSEFCSDPHKYQQEISRDAMIFPKSFGLCCATEDRGNVCHDDTKQQLNKQVTESSDAKICMNTFQNCQLVMTLAQGRQMRFKLPCNVRFIMDTFVVYNGRGSQKRAGISQNLNNSMVLKTFLLFLCGISWLQEENTYEPVSVNRDAGEKL